MPQDKKTLENCRALHIWRDGLTYFNQNRDVLLAEFENVMFSDLPTMPGAGFVRRDLRKTTLSFEDAAFDAVYANHILEHLEPGEALFFLEEIKRVMVPGGTLRISVPDLEYPAKAYLDALSRYDREPNDNHAAVIEWYRIEILDQMAREKPGGRMWQAYHSGEAWARVEETRFSEALEPTIPVGSKPIDRRRAWWDRLKRYANPVRLCNALVLKARWRVYRFREERTLKRNKAHFRDSLEIERAKFDRHSLHGLLEVAGFVSIRPVDFDTSSIPGWDRFQLDRSKHTGRPLDPSVYMEANR